MTPQPGIVRQAPLFLLAGALQGLAFLAEALQPLAWLGVAALACAIRGASRRARLVGILAASFVSQAIALAWLRATLVEYLHIGRVAALLLCTVILAASAVVVMAPSVLVAWWAGARPVRLWLPASWALGELLRSRLTEFTMTDLLHSQWAVAIVLRGLAALGWYPLLLAGVAAAAGVGEALFERRARPLLPSVFAALALALLPALRADDGALAGVAAIHLASEEVAPPPPPAPSPPELILWPEAILRGALPAAEGSPATPQIVAAFDGQWAEQAPHHLVGTVATTGRRRMNAVALVDSRRRLLALRGKTALVPVVERSFAGLPVAQGPGFERGERDPLLVAGRRRILALVCYEVFSRQVVERGRAAGAQLIAVLSRDRPLAGSPIAHAQSLGALILRSVETHLPAGRAALGGHAAFISTDGRVLARSPAGGSGMLRR